MNQMAMPCARGALWRRVVRSSCAWAILLFGASLFAQRAGDGTVVGVVSNKATGDLLAGASISVEGGQAAAISERGGDFRLHLPPGMHTLVVSYAGLDTARVPVSVEAGRTASVSVPLTSGVYVLEAVAVKGIREGSALAIQQQRQAPNAKVVVAADTFGSPAANPGELLQRLPGISTEIVGSEVRTINIRGMGPGFSALMVDGERVATSQGTSIDRQYQIEQFGTGNIESVELIKAPKPEDDANAVAGFINLISKRAFDLPGRRIGVSAGTMWRKRGFSGSPFKDDPDNIDVVGLNYSNVFSVLGRENNLGVAFNVNRRISYTTQDEIGPGGVFYTAFGQAYLNATSANPLTRVFGTGDFGYKAESHNIGLNVDYKLSPDAFAFVKLGLNTNYQFQEYHRAAIGDPAATAAHFAAGSTYEHSFFLPHTQAATTPSARVESAPFTKKSLNYSLLGGSEHKLFGGDVTLTWRANYSHANINYPHWIRAEASAYGVGFEIDRRGQDPWYPLLTQTAGPSWSDPGSYLMRTYSRQSNKAPNDLYGARIDLRKDFRTAVPFSVKTGVKFNQDDRSQFLDYSQFTWVGADGVPLSGDDAMTPYTGVVYKQGDGRYGPFPFMPIPGFGRKGDPLLAPAGYWKQTANDAYTSVNTSNASDVKFSEKITAAYVSGNLQLGRLRMLAGLRAEQTDIEGTSWIRNQTAAFGGDNPAATQSSFDPNVVAAQAARAQKSFIGRRNSQGDYRKLFPGVHFVYEPRAGLLLRASYNASISRPPVPNLLPVASENAGTGKIDIGNPALRPYTSDNFELSAEKYFEPVGLFTVGVFLKEIKDYFRAFDTLIGPEGVDGNGLYAGRLASQVQNIGDARIRGAEFSYQQQFSFLPGFWKGFGVNANYSYTSAKGDFGTLATTSRLANLAPRTANAGLSYRGHGLQANLLANWTDMKYKSTSTVDIYNEARLMIDLKLQYTINRRFDVFLDATNLTDEPPRTDVSLNGLKFFKTNQGVGFTAGVRSRF